MITPQHQIYIQNTPNDGPNHGNLIDGCLNNGSLTDGHQVRQLHNAKFKRNHAQESLTIRVSKLICAVFLSILFLVGLVMFILWLSLRPHRPRFQIHEFSMPSLAETNGFSTAHVTFNLTSQNPNLEIGIYYDMMNLTLYYKDQNIAETPLLFPFYQSPKNTAIIYGTLSRPVLIINNVRWMQFLAARKLGVVSFRLDVTSSIRFKVSKWDSRHHKMHANCEIGVGPNGMLLASDREKKCPVYFS
uniref:NDR1/HIN1-like protein 26 n=1 Tax=Erigeron canadensis TaxID=72917 RepID=UPI001CB8EE3F|nr:NDR1/HIN1-like protein 26 [Erigeron canadensis]